MSPTTQQKNPPALAAIVREVTDDGRRIAEFYLGVADGSLEGFRDNHRMSAARRLDKIAPGLVREYLTKYHNAQVRESMRHTVFPMGTIQPTKKEQPERRGPDRFQRRLAQIVRQETGDGRNIVNFLIDVMNGALTGFKPHHRLDAASELVGCMTTVHPGPVAGPSPSPTTEQGQAEGGALTPSPSTGEGDSRRERNSSPSPSTGEGWGEGVVKSPITIEELERFDFTTEHADRYIFARDTITGAIYAFDGMGPLLIDEDGEPQDIAPDRIAGYDHASLMSEYRARFKSGSPAVPEESEPATAEPVEGSKRGTRRRPRLDTGPRPRKPRRIRRMEGSARAEMRRRKARNRPYPEGNDGAEKSAPVDLTPTERRIRERLKQRWHDPDPYDSSFDSTHAGRSPPW